MSWVEIKGIDFDNKFDKEEDLKTIEKLFEWENDFDWFWSFIVPIKEDVDDIIRKQTYSTEGTPLD